MAFKTFAALDVLTASDVNTYLMEQAVIRCTSATRPSSPAEGMFIYETDTNRFLVYTGAAWYAVAGTMPQIRLKRNSNQAIGNGGAGDAVSWDTELSGGDPDSQWAVGSNPTRVPLYMAGLWRVQFQMTSTGIQTTGMRIGYTRFNGASFDEGSDLRQVTPADTVTLSGVSAGGVYASDGNDFFEVYLYQNEGSAQNWKGWVSAVYEGPI